MDGLEALAGRRRGLATAALMLKVDRGDVPCVLVDRDERYPMEALAPFKHAAMQCDSRFNPMEAAAV